VAITDLLLYALPLAAGLLGLLFAPAVDRWADRFDAWVGRATLGRGSLAARAAGEPTIRGISYHIPSRLININGSPPRLRAWA
jgi:hypothetical protein